MEFLTFSERLQTLLAQLPKNPGVYLMKSATGEILYVGKAINLRNRVRSYFHAPQGAEPKVRALVAAIDHFETISTDTEVEALVLENTLIKKHQPHYNIRLKDDHTYPWLKLTLQEDFPRLLVTRQRLQDGARYFGPYPDVAAMHAMHRTIKQFFPLRQRSKPQHRDRACLNYAIGRCMGPCQQLVTSREYRAVVDQVIAYLEGRHQELLRELKANMLAASEALDFEKAARLRDAMASIQRLTESQKLVTEKPVDEDVVALAADELHAAIQLFEVRNGSVVARRAFILDRAESEPAEVLSSFLGQYYAEHERLPNGIILPFALPDQDVIERWLSDRRKKKVQLMVPKRGDKLKLLELVAYNAQQALANERLRRWAALERGPQAALTELARALGLEAPPRRIEGYDIAHVQGTDMVASMVVFEEGVPAKAEYRRFKLKTIEGIDDFAAMREVISRRFRHGNDWAQPDLVLIDGGKGQLSAALTALAGRPVPVFGLAKQFEEIFLPDQAEPVRLEPRSAALHLIQRLRDEAHRFANAFHGQLRGKRMTRSLLDEVPGLGPQRQKQLLKTLGSVDAMRSLSLEDLSARGGLPVRIAQNLFERLHPDMRA